MNYQQKRKEFFARLVDDTDSDRVSWNRHERPEKSEVYYHTDYDDEYHLLFFAGNPHGTSPRLELYEINGIPIGDLVDEIDCLNDLCAAILAQAERHRQNY